VVVKYALRGRVTPPLVVAHMDIMAVETKGSGVPIVVINLGTSAAKRLLTPVALMEIHQGVFSPAKGTYRREKKKKKKKRVKKWISFGK